MQVIQYTRKTKKMHTFINNLFYLIYPPHVSNKQLFINRKSSVEAAYSISPYILTHWGRGHLNYLNARYRGF